MIAETKQRETWSDVDVVKSRRHCIKNRVLNAET